MLFSQLEKITGGKAIRLVDDREINVLLTDSRKVTSTEGALFFAIRGNHHDGHQFLQNLYRQGIRYFVIEQTVGDIGEKANVLLVPSTIAALQQIVASHRQTIKAPVIGITGSNGKTIIKEWLYQLLSPEFKIAKNPASYNSQLGVPLSVWQLRPHHTLGIFEAGISTVGEMNNLRKIMKPTIGVFTNIGSAHNEGFSSIHEKVREKMELFRDTPLLIYCKDHELIDAAVKETGIKGYSWGYDERADVKISRADQAFSVSSPETEFVVQLPFSDAASLENCFHCLLILLHFGYGKEEIQRRLATLRSIPMRLELKEGINRCQIIDDTYNNDLAGLQVSVDFLAQQQLRKQKRVILSDIHESGLPDSTLVQRVSSIVKSANIQNFVGIGPVLHAHQQEFPGGSQFYKSTDEFLSGFNFGSLHDEVVLIKGARIFTFEKVVNQLQRKVHGTVMEIDMGALVHNLNYFKSCIKPATKVMAMVKAFAYGSGSNEIANLLQYHKVDYLGVAYADEGVELRKNNIKLPVMVMNPAEESFDTILRHQLEPEIYSFKVLHQLSLFLGDRPCHVHIKLDTGMHRLGFGDEEIDGLTTLLLQHPNMKVATIFSHLAAADEESHDEFTKRQGKAFQKMADLISQRLGYRPIYHLLNSSGILRFPELQFDMVRLGIGLYGIDPTTRKTTELKPVATLKTIISQIKHIPEGESIGYGRKGVAEKALTIATIAIGYADGFSRAFSQGVGKVLVNGKLAPVMGNVCMDMTMIDITGIPATEGDEVVIFGSEPQIEQLAQSIGTIPYEILTSTSERVKRIFVAESI